MSAQPEVEQNEETKEIADIIARARAAQAQIEN
jgi:hypothetical protein